MSSQQRNAEVRKRLHDRLNAAKSAVATNTDLVAGVPEDFHRVFAEMAPIRAALGQKRKLEKSVHYDVHVAPHLYLCANVEMARLRESRGFKPLACAPMRSSFVPASVTVDAFVAAYNLLGDTKQPKAADRFDVWRRILPDIDSPRLKASGNRVFSGTVMTDGVSISLLYAVPTRRGCNGNAATLAKRKREEAFVRTGRTQAEQHRDPTDPIAYRRRGRFSQEPHGRARARGRSPRGRSSR